MSAKKKVLNLTVDEEVKQFYTDYYPGMAARIVNSVSLEFMEKVQRDPSYLQKLIHRELTFCEKQKIKSKKD